MYSQTENSVCQDVCYTKTAKNMARYCVQLQRLSLSLSLYLSLAFVPSLCLTLSHSHSLFFSLCPSLSFSVAFPPTFSHAAFFAFPPRLFFRLRGGGIGEGISGGKGGGISVGIFTCIPPYSPTKNIGKVQILAWGNTFRILGI